MVTDLLNSTEQLVSRLSILNLALRVERHQLVSELLRIKSPEHPAGNFKQAPITRFVGKISSGMFESR